MRSADWQSRAAALPPPLTARGRRRLPTQASTKSPRPGPRGSVEPAQTSSRDGPRASPPNAEARERDPRVLDLVDGGRVRAATNPAGAPIARAYHRPRERRDRSVLERCGPRENGPPPEDARRRCRHADSQSLRLVGRYHGGKLLQGRIRLMATRPGPSCACRPWSPRSCAPWPGTRRIRGTPWAPQRRPRREGPGSERAGRAPGLFAHRGDAMRSPTTADRPVSPPCAALVRRVGACRGRRPHPRLVPSWRRDHRPGARPRLGDHTVATPLSAPVGLSAFVVGRGRPPANKQTSAAFLRGRGPRVPEPRRRQNTSPRTQRMCPRMRERVPAGRRQLGSSDHPPAWRTVSPTVSLSDACRHPRCPRRPYCPRITSVQSRRASLARLVLHRSHHALRLLAAARKTKLVTTGEGRRPQKTGRVRRSKTVSEVGAASPLPLRACAAKGQAGVTTTSESRMGNVEDHAMPPPTLSGTTIERRLAGWPDVERHSTERYTRVAAAELRHGPIHASSPAAVGRPDSVSPARHRRSARGCTVMASTRHPDCTVVRRRVAVVAETAPARPVAARGLANAQIPYRSTGLHRARGQHPSPDTAPPSSQASAPFRRPTLRRLARKHR
jgi:hypothetical protein